jgi:hypothetical protein
LPIIMRRPFIAALVMLAFVAAMTSPWAPAPTSAQSGPVRINEVEPNGGMPGDWVELINVGISPVDVSGLRFLDNDITHVFYVIPAGTVIPAGGYLVLEEAQFGFGLGGANSAQLFAADGVTVIDSYSWTAHAATTYGRCPNGTGAFITTASSMKGAANDCGGATPAAVKIN